MLNVFEKAVQRNKMDLANAIHRLLMRATVFGLKDAVLHEDRVFVNMDNGNRFEISMKLVSEKFGAKQVDDTDPPPTQHFS
jgi:hypothetical protein